ncbi:MAG: hypothetical protein KDD48_06235 [Bdellovibrionales bacterium]|nr:hypothetical protein [Bdellovibrionales bacterium]
MLKKQTEDEIRLYGEIDKLVTIVVEGQAFQVPEHLELLRCFQFLGFKIAFENFCWNANCENCAANVRKQGQSFERMLCCQDVAREGMEIEKLPSGVQIK